ncbi:MAG TPA: YbhB/YbcL family Raf kinase inhibitor-like protein [Isosphaeraceae bacterium]|nr:YbhB/YbcL family Raf kinase inhibitor-like protein [Isosphaeraceae bacterium]
MSLKVLSPVFSEGTPIPRRYTGDGEDLSPPLSWSGLPAAARELALIVDDPDAPTKEPWVHWVIYNLPSTLSELAEGITPIAHAPVAPGVVQGKNSWNSVGFQGPAPPKGHGIHHYYFRLYALDTSLRLPEGLDKAGLLKRMEGHIVSEAVLMGTYHR